MRVAARDTGAHGETAVPPQATRASFPEKLKWPKTLSAQVAAIRKLLPATGPDASALAGHFGKRTKARIAHIEDILETLTTLGRL